MRRVNAVGWRSVLMVAALAAAGCDKKMNDYITPPTVQVSCAYPGTSAEVVAATVAAPIEQQINGVANMLYMSSQSNHSGSYNLTITFKLGPNLDMAQVLVQNREAMAVPSLPESVRQTGVTTRKRSPNILLVVNCYSPGGEKDQLFVSNYASIYLKDEIARLDGVGDVFIFGQQDFAMRLWLDPERMASRSLTAAPAHRPPPLPHAS